MGAQWAARDVHIQVLLEVRGMCVRTIGVIAFIM